MYWMSEVIVALEFLILCRRAAGVHSFVVLGRFRGSVVLIIKLFNSFYGKIIPLKKFMNIIDMINQLILSSSDELES